MNDTQKRIEKLGMSKAFEIDTADAGSRFKIEGYLYLRLQDCERTHFTGMVANLQTGEVLRWDKLCERNQLVKRIS